MISTTPNRCGGLTWRPKLGVWSAANVELDAEELSAHSYGWWQFLKRFPDGRLVFNPYRYSVTTAKHQSKVRAWLSCRDLNHYIEIESPQGLNDLGSATYYYLNQIAALHDEINARGSRSTKNQERREMIRDHERKIAVIQELVETLAQHGYEASRGVR